MTNYKVMLEYRRRRKTWLLVVIPSMLLFVVSFISLYLEFYVDIAFFFATLSITTFIFISYAIYRCPQCNAVIKSNRGVYLNADECPKCATSFRCESADEVNTNLHGDYLKINIWKRTSMALLASCLFSTIFALLASGDLVSQKNHAKDSSNDSYKLLRDEAFRKHNQGMHEEAMNIYNEILLAEENDSEILYWRAMAYIAQENTVMALNDLISVSKVDPTNYDAFIYADRIMSKEKRWDEVIELWNRRIKQSPNDAKSYYERAGTYHHKGDNEAASRDARKACDFGLSEACARVNN